MKYAHQQRMEVNLSVQVDKPRKLDIDVSYVEPSAMMGPRRRFILGEPAVMLEEVSLSRLPSVLERLWRRLFTILPSGAISTLRVRSARRSPFSLRTAKTA